MDPILFTYHTPKHPSEMVASHVVRQHVGDHLLRWQRMSGASEVVYLATCQRVLWIFWGGDGDALGFAPGIDRFQGQAAWRHLLEVATGLNSANLGDREILEQMRLALRTAQEVGSAGEEAQTALEDVLREAQRLRSRIGLADGSASVSTVALKHLQAALAPGASVALVGVGPMCQYLAQRLAERGYRVSVANRTHWKAEAMGLPTVSMERLQRDPRGFDALVTATSSPTPLFTLDAWSRLEPGNLLLLDLALPCDSEPSLAQLAWVTRRDLSDLTAETEQAKACRKEAARQAEPFILGASARLQERAMSRFRKRSLRTAQDRLTEAWQNLEEEAFTPDGPLAGLTPSQCEAVERILRKGRTLAFRSMNVLGEPCKDVPRTQEAALAGAGLRTPESDADPVSTISRCAMKEAFA